MPKTIEEYRQSWLEKVEGDEEGRPDQDYITPTSCIITGSDLRSGPGMSDAFWVFDDFGDAICCYRYWEINRGFMIRTGGQHLLQ